LAAKNRFKSKLSNHKYTSSALSKLVANNKDELKIAKAAEQRALDSKKVMVLME
jgi:hypothetical protein